MCIRDRYRGVEIIEGHLMIDHVHMLVMIPPKESVSSVSYTHLFVVKENQVTKEFAFEIEVRDTKAPDITLTKEKDSIELGSQLNITPVSYTHLYELFNHLYNTRVYGIKVWNSVFE